MLQIVLESPYKFVAQHNAEPVASTGEVLVEIAKVGLCGSDFHAFTGTHPAYVYPRILGHELACRIVSASPNDRGLAIGDACAIEPYLSCGFCRMCKAGRTNCCENLRVVGVHRDGGMQDYLAVPIRLLHPSGSLSMDELALVETLGIGAHAVDRCGVKAGQQVAVVGAGPIGLGTAIFAEAAGANVTVFEINEERRKFASERGFTSAFPTSESTAEVVFDATGNAAVMSRSLEVVAPGGKLVYVGLTSASVALDDALFHRREVTLFASRNSVNQFPRIIRMLEGGSISVRNWVTDRLTLAEVPAAFDGLRTRKQLFKAIVDVREKRSTT